MDLGNRRGQKTSEFAVLIGMVALATISIQPIVRRAVERVIQHVSDTALGPPPPADPNADAERELLATFSQSLDETGQADFRRITQTTSTATGHAVNEDVRFRRLPDE